ncbi:mitochondrial protein [Flagelloscypha sp. PMI_526]|nr:mitochondrial protein [Flagelloscypha sp. PMI_526]
MSALLRHVVVVGGNGFVGSAVCRIALASNLQVTSISSSGRPYETAKGHTPAWVHKVNWQKGDALNPSTFEHLFDDAYAVVHTLGTLFEGSSGDYKTALRQSNFSALAQNFVGALTSRSPLQASSNRSYQALNRDSALRVCEAFLRSRPPKTPEAPRPFVYLSAEDVFRPFVPAGYIITKRQAEIAIRENVKDGQGQFKPVFIRPGLIYHAHQRPLTTLPATLIDVSSTLHKKAIGYPTPAGVLRSLAPRGTSEDLSDASPFSAIANAMTVPPLHVDQVAQTIVKALDPDRQDIVNVVGVEEMTALLREERNSVAYSS